MATNRPAVRPISNASATAQTSSRTWPMSDLFDLPFEEEKDDRPEHSPGQRPPPTDIGSQPTEAAQQQIATGRQSEDIRPPIVRRILTVTELTVRVRDLL